MVNKSAKISISIFLRLTASHALASEREAYTKKFDFFVNHDLFFVNKIHLIVQTGSKEIFVRYIKL